MIKNYIIHSADRSAVWAGRAHFCPSQKKLCDFWKIGTLLLEASTPLCVVFSQLFGLPPTMVASKENQEEADTLSLQSHPEPQSLCPLCGKSPGCLDSREETHTLTLDGGVTSFLECLGWEMTLWPSSENTICHSKQYLASFPQSVLTYKLNFSAPSQVQCVMVCVWLSPQASCTHGG